MEKVFEQIISDTTQKKRVISLSKKLAKKCSLKSNEDLENLKNLAYWLYIYNKTDDSFQVCSILQNIDIPEERDLYTWLRLVFALNSRLLRERGDEEESKKYIEKIESMIKSKVLKRILNGELLYDSKIKEWVEKGDEDSANNWRFLQIGMLCLIRELGGSETYPIEILDNEIGSLKAILSGVQ